MSVSSIVVTVHCNGAFHEPLTLRFAQDRVLKSDISRQLRIREWHMASDGQTYCSQHKVKR